MLKLNAIIKRKNPDNTSKKVSKKQPDRPRISVKKIFPEQNPRLDKTISFLIDDHSMQMAAVKHWGKARKILGIKKYYFPKTNFTQEKKRQFISNKIIEFRNQYGNSLTKITLSVSGKETTFRTFLMPALRKKELESAIQFEVKKQIPFPIEECNYDYRPVYEIIEKNQSRYKIVLQAATKKYINELLEPFESHGIEIFNIYVTHDVVGQLLKHLGEFKEGNNYTLLNIGLSSTEISFYKGSNLEFSHLSSISSVLLGEQPDRTRYEYFAELIANEIQTSLDFYAGQYSTGSSNIIYVYGDLANSPELLDLLNKKTGIEVEIFPVERLNFLTPKDLSLPKVLPVCLPVLAASVCQSSLANLLPPEEKLARKQARTNSYFKFALVMLTLIMVVSWRVMSGKINHGRDNLAGLNNQIELFRNSDAFHTYNLIKRQIAIDQSYLEKTKDSPSYLNLNLKELSNLTPSAVRLFFLDYHSDLPGQNLYVQGVVESDNIPPEIILAEYVENLSASPFYEDVTIVRHIKKNVNSHFEIEFHLKMRGIV